MSHEKKSIVGTLFTRFKNVMHVYQLSRGGVQSLIDEGNNSSSRGNVCSHRELM